MTRLSDRNASIALDQMKAEIANELDANLTDEERLDGTMTSNLVERAEKKLNKKSKNL